VWRGDPVIRRHLVGLYVAFHVLAVVIAAVPGTGKMLDRRAWEEPTVQAEFEAWAERFGTDSATLQAFAFDGATRVLEIRAMVLTPFEPYLRLTGQWQNWVMFVAPHRYPTRLQLRVKEASGDWRVLYEEGNPAARWRSAAFATERMRSSVFRWGWPSYEKAWAAACRALARAAKADDPTIMKMQCRFWKQRSPSPEEVLSGTEPDGAWVLTRVEVP
jgi:hypothetical protein